MQIRTYLDDIGSYRPIPKEEELELIKKANLGSNQARDQVINSNLLFVVAIVAKYAKNKIARKHLDDLIQEGNIGLILALQRFDPSRGFRLITYASSSIRKSINHYLTSLVQNRTISFFDGSPDNDLSESLADKAEFDEALYSSERIAAIHQALERMPINDQDLIIRRYFHCISIDELCRHHRKSRARLYVSLNKAVDRLYEFMLISR